MNKELEEPKVRIYEILDKRNSSYKLEGTDNVFLNGAAKHIIPSVSVHVTEKGEYIRWRWIKGCKELDIQKQKAMGFTPNLSTGADTICFEFNKLLVIDEGDGKTLCQYLDGIILNKTNSKNKPGVTPIFYEIRKESDAEKAIEDFFDQKKINDMMSKLVIEENGALKFKKGNIDALCSLFGISMAGTTYKEKLQALIDFSRVQPKLFINSIADEKANIRSIVMLGLNEKVIAFDDNRLIFSETNKVIKAVKSKDYDDRITEAVDYLLSSDAFDDLKQLEVKVKHSNELNLLASTS